MVSQDLFVDRARVLGVINRLYKRTAHRRDKVPSEDINAENAGNCPESYSPVTDAPRIGSSILGWRGGLLLVQRQAIIPLGASAFYPVPCTRHHIGAVLVGKEVWKWIFIEDVEQGPASRG